MLVEEWLRMVGIEADEKYIIFATPIGTKVSIHIGLLGSALSLATAHIVSAVRGKDEAFVSRGMQPRSFTYRNRRGLSNETTPYHQHA